MKIFCYFLFILSLSAQQRWDVRAQSEYSKFLVGERVENLQISDGVSLVDPQVLTVLLAFDSDCPLSRKLAPAVKRVEEKFTKEKVRFVHLSVSGFDSREKVRDVFEERGFKGELVFDEDQRFQRSLEIRTTCEVFVIDVSGTVVYRGAVNDQYGIGFTRDKSKNRYLVKAIEGALKQQFPKVRLTSAPGCLLDIESSNVNFPKSVTFHNQISRIMQNHCQSCHRKGGVGPFELVKYDQVKGRSKMIKYVVEKKIMPPWFAEEGGPWQNDCSLSKKDEQAILTWIKNKCPEGDPKESPVPLKWESKWQLNEPDFILKLPQIVSVPAEGRVPYINVYVQIPFKEDRWVSSMEIRSEQPQVLHHVLIMDDKTGAKTLNKRRFGGGVQGFLGGLVPGQSLTEYPEGTGKILRAGSWLKFQLHYTPNGKAVKDNISLALKFYAQPPAKKILTVSAFNARFAIPPNHPDYKVQSVYRFPVNATVLAFSPHTHLRGKSFKYELHYPNGKKKTVLDVPNYDFNWQLRYILKEPLKVPIGSKMICTAIYDNSEDNPANPNPNARVRFGDQTEDEMMIGYFEGFIGY